MCMVDKHPVCLSINCTNSKSTYIHTCTPGYLCRLPKNFANNVKALKQSKINAKNLTIFQQKEIKKELSNRKNSLNAVNKHKHIYYIAYSYMCTSIPI